jgi:hypothetical protein
MAHGGNIDNLNLKVEELMALSLAQYTVSFPADLFSKNRITINPVVIFLCGDSENRHSCFL